jgi:predicted AAA+ superfamily ATPase
MKYDPRIVDSELSSRLNAAGAVVIEGPKACGKTATARQIAKSAVLLDVDEQALLAADVTPSVVLEGPTPRLIDEWQLAPRLWNHVRRAVDDRGQPGQFILTGSSVPSDDATRHSGAGRFSRIRMRPMSLFELGISEGSVSLAAVLRGGSVATADTGLTVAAVVDLIIRGGWPGMRASTQAEAQQGVRDYLEEIARVDMPRMEGIRRDPARIHRLLRSLARNVATSASLTTLARDTDGPDGPLKDDTVRDYLAALSRLFIVEDQPAWGPHLRSKYVLRQAPKRHFVDPSLACAALNADSQALLQDLNFLGFLFESMVVRDLRVYAQSVGSSVLHYRDSDDLEIDTIVQGGEGRWAAFEIKLGGEELIEEAAKNLLTFASRIDTSRVGEPAALGVVVASGWGYTRQDGVSIIPVGSLGP